MVIRKARRKRGPQLVSSRSSGRAASAKWQRAFDIAGGVLLIFSGLYMSNAYVVPIPALAAQRSVLRQPERLKRALILRSASSAARSPASISAFSVAGDMSWCSGSFGSITTSAESRSSSASLRVRIEKPW